MSESYLAILLWHNPAKRFGCICDISGSTYLFKDDCLAREFVLTPPAPSTIVSFRVEFLENSPSARNDYNIIVVEPADLDFIDDGDLETLTRAFATYCDKEERKRQTQTSDYGIRRSRQLVQEKYGITPLRDRFKEE